MQKNNLLPQNKLILVGQFGAPYGLRGWLKLHSFTEPAQNILHYHHWFVQKRSDWKPIFVESSKADRTPMLVKLKGCETPEQASAYTQANIGVMRDEFPNIGTDEFYWADLENLTVVNTLGEKLGKVDHLLSTGANDVMIVKGERERWLPFIKDIVLDVNFENKTILVLWDSDF